MSTSERYEKDDRESLENEDSRGLLSEEGQRIKKQPRSSRCSRLLLPIIVGVLALTNIASLAIILRRKPCLPGPVYPKLKGVNPNYHWVQFQATITKQSQYVAKPSPEVDALWDDLGVGLDELLISTRFGWEADISPDHITLELEPGDPQFVVSVEAFHQMHCLNLLRKSLFTNVDYYRGLGSEEFFNDGHLLSMHINHCLDMLRERLMCTADAGLMPYYWVLKNESVSDFKRDHHCRDYSSLLAWGKRAKRLPEGTTLVGMEPPEGAFILSEYP
ncbi:hypothetical protein QBC47DRAFT_398892 [Echria macrotheca]|uniref:Tat pathway signal sequence n=1 Tax=Echria macrotheca TaxID=438768 RepID=A0AAJ0BHG8_9PEZI|nr:hypothetical protein QBC47DRAFT_398892 [Echria macrotheca]